MTAQSIQARDGGAEDHIVIQPSVNYVGTPVALITTCNEDGSVNISPMSSAWALGDRFVLGMASSSLGAENARRAREMVINFPGPESWRAVEAMARATGRDPVPRHKAEIGYVFEPDKFGLSGLTPQPSDLVKPWRIAECPLQFEAEVLAVHEPADRPAGAEASFFIVETRVRRVHAHRGIVIEGTSYIDTSRWQPLLYVFRHYFPTGARLGRNFKAQA